MGTGILWEDENCPGNYIRVMVAQVLEKKKKKKFSLSNCTF